MRSGTLTADEGEVVVFAVDRAWGNVRHTSDGDPTYATRLHRIRADRDMPACGARVFLVEDHPYPLSIVPATRVCRRCVPTVARSRQ